MKQARPIIRADEAYYTILESDTINTYYSVFLLRKHDKYGIMLYHHDPFLSCLKVFRLPTCGSLSSMPNVILVVCRAYVFYEAVSKNASDSSFANQGLIYCNQIFQVKKSLRIIKQTSTAQNLNDRVFPLVQRKRGYYFAGF